MAFNPDYLDNLSSPSSLMRSSNPGKASAKRKKHSFRVKRKPGEPPQFIPRSQLPKKYRSTTYAEICDPYRRMALDDNPVMPATTARNNDGMSFVW